MPLPRSDGDIATAHVVPLGRPDLGERPPAAAPGAATGAVFVVRADRQDLLAKTGTLRQAQRIAQVHRLASPVQLGAVQCRPA